MNGNNHYCENCYYYDVDREYCEASKREVREAVLDQLVRCFMEGQDQFLCEYFKLKKED